MLLASAPLFALVWIPRRFLGRLKGGPHLRARGVSLLAVLCLLSAAGLVIASGDDLIPRLGNPTSWSVGFCVLTLVFAALAVLGLWLAMRVPAGTGKRVARIHTLLVASANTLVAGYLLYWGIIGIRSWM